MATRRGSRAVKAAAAAVLLFLHFPVALIALYAFSAEEASFQFPPPALTTKWFGVAWGRQDVRDAMSLSIRVAAISTVIALVLGTLVAGAVWRTKFFGRNALSLMIVLPIALPGIVTGIALRASINLAGVSFSIWTLVIGHATFCVAVAYNNVIARLRRTNPSMIDASMDLGAHGWQTFRHVIFPQLGSAIVTGGLLAFALSFDEVIVTTFTAGNQQTVPIWIFSQLVRPRDRPVTNVVALAVILLTMVPIIFAVRLSERGDET